MQPGVIESGRKVILSPSSGFPAGVMTELTSLEQKSVAARDACEPPDVRAVPNDEPALRALLSRVALADQAAFAQLHENTVAKLYAVARLILKNSHDAEEAVCDAYTQIWHDAHRYDPARANVMGWMLVICRARALDLFRRRRVRERVAELQPDHDDASSPGADDLLQSLQSGSAVHCALQALPEVKRKLITLAFLQDLSHEEIAARTQLPIGTVKSHIRRGLETLREVLQAGAML